MNSGVVCTSTYRSVFAAVVALFVLSITPGATRAQSGRKLPDWNKKQPAPTPAPTPDTSTDAVQNGAQQTKPSIPLAVTTFLPDINSSSIFTDVVARGCIDRLGQASMFTIMRERQMNRQQASDKAKSMQNGYFVWMQLEQDIADEENASIGPVDWSLLYVKFIVFNSATGKIKTQGRVYQRPNYNGIPTPNTQATIEDRLRLAGRETADRVMEAIGVQPPPGH